MSIEERVAALETEQKGQKEWLKSMDEKLDTLIAAMNVGKGVWFAMLKMGAIIGFLVGAVAALNSYFHWWK